MKTSDPQREVIERAQWMRLARRQSQALAGAREDLQVPLRWDALQEVPRRAARRPLRLSWALALFPALILGGATGTWAFVRHLQLQAPAPAPAPAPAKSVSAPPAQPAPTPARRARALPPPPPTPAVVVEPEPPARRASRKAVRVKQVAAPPAAPPSDPAAGPVIVIPTRVIGEDQVIIVSPPAKMKPLWTVESYKESRGRAGTPGR